MATEEVSMAGRLLAALRAKRGLTAAELAALVPADSMTKTVITNLESGRKRDLTVTELMQLAAALRVSPLALMVDIEDPWGWVCVEGLAPPYEGLMNIEYVAKSQVLATPPGAPTPTSLWGVSDLLEALTNAERGVRAFREVHDSVAAGDPWRREGVAWTLRATPETEARLETIPAHRGAHVLISELDSPTRATYSSVVLEMQELLRQLSVIEALPSGHSAWAMLPQFPLPPDVWGRINEIADVTASILADVPAPSADYDTADPLDMVPASLRSKLRHPRLLEALFTSPPPADPTATRRGISSARRPKRTKPTEDLDG